MNEAMKIKPKIAKYLSGKILDIGCGDKKITDMAIGIDGRDLPSVDIVLKDKFDIYNLHMKEELQNVNVIFSSHVLEHLYEPYTFIWSTNAMLSVGGYLILYLPDGRKYDDFSNPEHLHTFRYEIFLRWFKASFDDQFEIVESDLDIEEDDHYSFYIVAKKR
ncbi:MAG: hypothetical protein JSU91_01785 [Thermoplasmatales archaeon]|nr:MAG: hypothetical protein JSU91_01785 [Thermoplasmatales archaeon]